MGWPPTDLKARTGELTPPGISSCTGRTEKKNDSEANSSQQTENNVSDGEDGFIPPLTFHQTCKFTCASLKISSDFVVVQASETATALHASLTEGTLFAPSGLELESKVQPAIDEDMLDKRDATWERAMVVELVSNAGMIAPERDLREYCTELAVVIMSFLRW